MGKTLEAYRDDLREYLQDHPALNRLLLLEEESTDSSLEFAINQALDRYNTRIPPLLPVVSLSNFPSDSLLVQLAASNVLEMVGILRTRNSLNYADSGLSVKDTEKSQEYRAWAMQFKQEATRDATILKQIKNAEGIMRGGGIGSGYALI